MYNVYTPDSVVSNDPSLNSQPDCHFEPKKDEIVLMFVKQNSNTCTFYLHFNRVF